MYSLRQPYSVGKIQEGAVTAGKQNNTACNYR